MKTSFLFVRNVYLSKKYKAHFGEKSYFLSSLACVLDLSSNEFLEVVNLFIVNKSITTIYIVNSSLCETNTINNFENKTKFQDFSNLKNNLQYRILNLKEQAKRLNKASYLHHKILDGDIELKGLIYHTKTDTFTIVNLIDESYSLFDI